MNCFSINIYIVNIDKVVGDKNVHSSDLEAPSRKHTALV